MWKVYLEIRDIEMLLDGGGIDGVVHVQIWWDDRRSISLSSGHNFPHEAHPSTYPTRAVFASSCRFLIPTNLSHQNQIVTIKPYPDTADWDWPEESQKNWKEVTAKGEEYLALYHHWYNSDARSNFLDKFPHELFPHELSFGRESRFRHRCIRQDAPPSIVSLRG